MGRKLERIHKMTADRIETTEPKLDGLQSILDRELLGMCEGIDKLLAAMNHLTPEPSPEPEPAPEPTVESAAEPAVETAACELVYIDTSAQKKEAQLNWSV